MMLLDFSISFFLFTETLVGTEGFFFLLFVFAFCYLFVCSSFCGDDFLGLGFIMFGNKGEKCIKSIQAIWSERERRSPLVVLCC